MSATALACALVAGLAVGYAVEETRRLKSGRTMRFVGRAQALRRVVGALLVAVLMVLVEVGLEVIDPRDNLAGWAAVWLAALVVLVTVLVLGVLDFGEVRANEEIEKTKQFLRSKVARGSTGEEDGESSD